MSFATGPILSRTLGEAGRGSLAAVLVPIQLAGWALVLGVPYASALLLRRHQRASLLNGAWALTAAVALPVCMALFLAAPALLEAHPPETVRWFRFGLLGSVLGVPAATALQLRLVTTGASGRFSAAKAANLFAYTALVVGLAIAGRLTLGTALGAWLVTYLVSRIAMVALLRAWPTARPPPGLLRQQLVVGRAHAVVTVATISLGRIDQIFLSFLGTSAELGLYAVAATAAQVSLPIAKGIAEVVFPDVMARRDSDISGRAIGAVFAVSVAVGAVSAAIAPWLIPAVFGEPFVDSVPLLWWLIPGQVLFNTAWVISARHLGAGSARIPATAIAVAAAVNVVAIAPAVNLFGPSGAAALTSGCQTIFLVLMQPGLRPMPQP